jgi:D-alanyl-D-alanine carboxypeptidase
MEVADVSHGLYGLGLTFNEGLGFGHDGAHLSYISTLRYNPATKTTVLMVATLIKVGSTPAESNTAFVELAYGVRNGALRAAQLVNR